MSSTDEENWEDENNNAGGAAANNEQHILQNSDDDDDDDDGQIVGQQAAMTTLNHQNLGLEDSSDEEDQANGGGGEMMTQDIVDEEEVDVLDLDVEDQVVVNDSDSLLMRFCPHDSSMLYPKECKRTVSLRYACRLCRYSEEAPNAIIYRNTIIHEVGNVLHKVPSAVSDDPTLPRSQQASCENCGHNEAVFFQSDSSNAAGDSLALIFVCCNCDYKWVG